MKFVIVNHGIFPYLLGGMERHTANLASHLVKLGVEVEVIIPELERHDPNVKFPFKLVELPWPAASRWLRANYGFSQHVRDYLKKNDYDFLYAQGFNAWAVLENGSRGASAKPSLYNPHGLEMFKTVGMWQTLKHFPLRRAARIQAAGANRIVSLGGHLTNQIHRFFNASEQQIVILPNAVDLDYIDEISSYEGERETGQFVFIGRLQANKGVQYLCQAFQKFPKQKLVIVGSGPLEKQLRAQYESNHIKFLGNLDDADLFDLYCRSDALAFPSLYEGMPTVILEAMACRLPIIATDIGAVKTMVKSDNGFIIRPGKVADIVDALNKYLALGDADKQAMREASRKRVSKEFTWPLIADRTLQAANSLIEQ